MTEAQKITAFITAGNVTKCPTRKARGYKGQLSHHTKAPKALLAIYAPAKNTGATLISDKWLGSACEVYTLSGVKRAVVADNVEGSARIRTYDGFVIYVNWPTVNRKMQAERLFYAC